MLMGMQVYGELFIMFVNIAVCVCVCGKMAYDNMNGVSFANPKPLSFP